MKKLTLILKTISRAAHSLKEKNNMPILRKIARALSS
jgi:hypothetical protein